MHQQHIASGLPHDRNGGRAKHPDRPMPVNARHDEVDAFAPGMLRDRVAGGALGQDHLLRGRPAAELVGERGEPLRRLVPIPGARVDVLRADGVVRNSRRVMFDHMQQREPGAVTFSLGSSSVDCGAAEDREVDGDEYAAVIVHTVSHPSLQLPLRFSEDFRMPKHRSQRTGSPSNARGAIDDIELGAHPSDEALVDEALQETFPASDPIAASAATRTVYEKRRAK